MHRTVTQFALSLSLAISLASQAQTNPEATESPSPATPLYRISFERGESVPGVAASQAIAMPFECTSDGTVFVNMVLQPPGYSSGKYSPPVEQLVSVRPSGEAHEFRLDQLTDLYDLQQKGYYASESNVVFLMIAAPEDKQGKEAFVTSDGTRHEVTRNLAEHHDYIVIFDRKGDYRRRVQLEDTFAVQRVGVFPSGAFLAFGFDKQDHSPKLAMLKEDGTLLKFLEIGKDDAPKSMFGTRDGSGKGPAVYIAPVQLVPHGDFILIVQNKTRFPLLEVNEAGAIRVIKPKLPEDVRIEMLVPSDENLYARVNPASNGSLYELNPQDGTVLRRFKLEDGRSGSGVACVHEGKFLSFDHGEGKLVPLIGTAEPAPDAASADQPKPTSAQADRQ